MSSIGSSLFSSAAQFLSLLGNSPSQDSKSGSAAATSAAPQDSSSSVSPFAQVLKKLESLSQSDPSKFQSLTAQIAAQLNTAASKATGSQAQFLSDLSGKFAQASKDGNITALEPSQSSQGSQGASGHHHHHHGGAAAYSASSGSDSTSDQQNVLQTIFNEVQSA